MVRPERGTGRSSPYGLVDALAWRGRSEEPPVEGDHELFGFLTTEANAVVAPIHPKAMPVILTTPAEVDAWLTADAPKALGLQRPLGDNVLRIVAKGEGRTAR